MKDSEYSGCAVAVSHLILAGMMRYDFDVAKAVEIVERASAAPDLYAAMPTIGHPGGKLVKMVAHYEDGSTQTIDGDVVTRAVRKAEGVHDERP